MLGKTQSRARLSPTQIKRCPVTALHSPARGCPLPGRRPAQIRPAHSAGLCPLPQSQAGQCRRHLALSLLHARPASHLLFFKLLFYFLSHSKWVCVFFFFWVSFALSVSLYVYLLCSLSSLTSSLFLATVSVSFSFSLSSPFLKPPEVRSLRGSQNASIQYRDPEIAANFLGI